MKKRILSLLLCLVMLVSLFAGLAVTASAAEPTSASEVKYVKDGGYVYNWGKRDTVATFLTTYAANYYTGSYSFDTLASKAGNSNSGTAFYSSALGTAIHNMLTSKQTYTTSYDSLKNFFRYTECEESSTSLISSYYSGTSMGNSWGSGWNREHTWPNSKGLDGSDENDVMMIKPTIEAENSDRGNKAYGEGSGYYDPNECGKQMHGDVARLMLQHLMRWGNTSYFYGTGGVMESRAILLKWLKEDPVDTWELGRNDAVQQITGVRNIFVDYPELAFLLLGEEIPDIDSPSGKAHELNGGGCIHNWKVTREVPATCTADGCLYYTCSLCNATKTEPIAAKGHQYNDSGVCTVCGAALKAGAFVLTDAPQDGDEVIIFNPGSSRAVSAVIKSSYYLDYADITPASKTIETENDAVIWKVSKTGSSYKFTNKAGTLSINWNSASSKTSLSLDGANPEMTLERCNAANSTYYIYSATQSGRFDHIYLEHYAQYNDFSAYDTSTDRASEKDFGFQFYAKTSGACAHNWTKTSETPATCTEAGSIGYKCSLCGATRTETVPATGHSFGNDNVCDICGYTKPAAGGQVVIYYLTGSKVMTTEEKVYNGKLELGAADAKLSGGIVSTEAENVALFTKIDNGDGTVTFKTSDGKYLYADSKDVKFVDAEEENTKFVLEEAAGGVYIRCATANYNGKAQYLEFYSGIFTVYGFNTSNTSIYTFGIYPVASDCEHNWEKTSETAATCTAAGSIVYTCSLCGEKKTETVPAPGHKPVTDAAVAATCTEKGLTEGSHCSVCNAILTEQTEIPAAGHKPVTDTAVAPTCTEPGKTEGSHCYVCNVILSAQTEIPALGHDWDEGTVTKAATEDEDGEKLYTCSRCGETRTEVIPALNHEHKFTETVVAPTCTEKGYTLHECYCGESYKDNYVDALGHTPVTDEAVAPTCTEPGKTEGSHCERCGEIIVAQEELAALGHNVVIDEAVAATCTEPGKTTGAHCSVCGEIIVAQEEIPATGHNYENGVCTDCGAEDPNYEPPTDPIETDPIETDPIETDPIETDPIETDPIETDPIETDPIETEPIETEPVETEPVATEEPCEGYTDIDRSAWYHEAADFVLARGIMSSTKTDAKTFEPYTVCTRSMIATMLYSLEGKPAVSFEAKFPDVKENQWFTDAVMWAYRNGVVTGYDNGNFGPNDKVTREQMAVILKAYAEKVKGIDTSETADLSKFADAAKVTWSKPYITWAVAEGLLSGKAVGDKLNLDPQGNATRAEVAAIMRSFITNIIEAAK